MEYLAEPMRTRRCRDNRRGHGPRAEFWGALSIAWVLGSSGCEASSDGEANEPTLTLTPCPGGGSFEAQCGTLTVPEDRGVAHGRQLELAIYLVPASSRGAAKDPVFLLAGGPGQGAAELGPYIAPRFTAILRERPIVFVDLRGTGSANPLRCDAEDPDDLAAMLGATLDLDALDACLASYGDADLRQYTTFAMIEDLEQVRAALGYAQINLLGISYGTRVALEYMRRYPERTRSAVLDGVVPADVEVSLAGPAHAEAALGLLLGDCRADPECAAAFPGLERKLEQVLRDLDDNRELERLDHPRTGAPLRVDITRAGFVGVLRMALYSGAYARLIPQLIERAHAGDYGPSAAVALHTAAMSKTISLGLYFTVSCSEDLRGLGPEARAAAVAGLSVFDDHLLAQLEQVCARWPHAELGPERFTALESSVPTLMLSGRYDPVTPPVLAEHAAATLSNARSLVAPHLSHGVWQQGCAPKLLAEFFANPDPAALDASCLDAIPGPHLFLGANGPRRLLERGEEPSR
jgi:pimeloyl-ACP methyl ester carboxylesterase